MLRRHELVGLFAILLGLLAYNTALADQIFVTNNGNGTIGEYTNAGGTVNPTLISVLSGPGGIVISGSDLFVSNSLNGTIGKYTTSGATVNPALISGLSLPAGIAVSGSDLFVVNQTSGTIGEYTNAGATVNPALISGLFAPYAIAVVATVPEPGSAILTLFGLALAGLAIKKIEKNWHNG